MKNYIKLFGLIALVAVIGFSMIACDEDSNSDSIVGTWTSSYTEEDVTVNVTLVFNSNGTGKLSASASGLTETLDFTWSQAGTTVTITAFGESEDFTFTGGNTLVFEGLTFKR